MALPYRDPARKRNAYESDQERVAGSSRWAQSRCVPINYISAGNSEHLHAARRTGHVTTNSRELALARPGIEVNGLVARISGSHPP